MWRQEDVYYALGGGIDAFTNERVTTPTAASEKIDAVAAARAGACLPIPPLMHGAGQFSIVPRACSRATPRCIVDKFDAEEMWRLVEKHKVNVIGVTGDAMARPLADALEEMQDDVDLSSLVSFGSTAAIFSQTVKEQLHGAAARHLVMTDAIGSTEIGHERHPLRAEGRRAEGRHHDGAGRRPTPSCSTTTSNPIEPGSGVVGRLARGGNIPLGYYNDPEKTAETFVTDAQGRRWSIPGDFATRRGRRPHHAARARLGVDQLRRREDLSPKRSRAR